MAKKRREGMLDADTYMTFSAERGYVWGPKAPAGCVPGTKPYWATGEPATWRYTEEVPS